MSRCVGRGDPVTGESAHRPGSTHRRHVSTNERRRNHDLPRANAAPPLEHQHSIRTVNSPRVLWLSPWTHRRIRRAGRSMHCGAPRSRSSAPLREQIRRRLGRGSPAERHHRSAGRSLASGSCQQGGAVTPEWLASFRHAGWPVWRLPSGPSAALAAAIRSWSRNPSATGTVVEEWV